jgi:hypothetical protein
MDLDLYRSVASDGYLAGIGRCSVADLRRMRAECQSLEDEVSLDRRMVQGHLDIVRHELDHRRAGGAALDDASRVGSLAEVLSGEGRSTGLAEVDEFAELDPHLADAVAALSDLSEPAVESLHDHLRDAERVLSKRRRRLFDRIDTLADELTRRYRWGEASVDTLLG